MYPSKILDTIYPKLRSDSFLLLRGLAAIMNRPHSDPIPVLDDGTTVSALSILLGCGDAPRTSGFGAEARADPYGHYTTGEFYIGLALGRLQHGQLLAIMAHAWALVNAR